MAQLRSKLAKTIANKHQAAASLMAPAPSATVPSCAGKSLEMDNSREHRNAVIHIDAPTKSIASTSVVRLG
jgi:hypothetical protein